MLDFLFAYVNDLVFLFPCFNHVHLSLLQEQQQKQLELILAIGKAGKLLENKTETGRRQASTELGKSVPVEEIKHLGVQTGLGTSNDKA